MSYRGIINNKIIVEVKNNEDNIMLKSEYKMQVLVYKKYSNIEGKKVRVIIDFNDIKNHYVFHEDLFCGEGIRL